MSHSKHLHPHRFVSLLIACGLALTVCCGGLRAAESAEEGDERALAQTILQTTGVQGGLVVHLGCGDGKLTAALRAGGQYLVHGLDRQPANVEQARTHIRSLGLYGPVAVEAWSGDRLPYADNLVNLLVVEQPRAAAGDEILRVLRPGGVAYIQEQGKWTKTVKPWPAEMDEWTHYLHGPGNNAVAADSVVGPPHHLQWIGGPKWARGHEVLATISAVISAGGRIFYIADEGPIASVDLPSKWVLVARDAFNGVLLWKRSIPKWESRYRPFRSGPTHLPRRLVAIGDTVFATLGFGEPLVALDAATGKVATTYQGTEGTEEVLFDQGQLFLVIGDPDDQLAADTAVRRGKPIPPVNKQIVAIQSESGDLLWRKSDDDTADLFAQTLAVSDGRVFFQNTRQVICLDAASGQQMWRAKRPASLKRPAWSTPTLVVYGDVVISADRQGPAELVDDSKPQRVEWSVSFQGGNAPAGELVAYAAKSGERLWSSTCREGYNSPVDVLLSDGLLWTGDLVRARDPGITEARDPLTGEVKRTRPSDQVFFTPGMSHHRCYRNRATERFLLLGRSGVELIDVKTGKAVANHWIRGTCQFGVMPANGLLYVPPHTCACYVKTKLNGFNALAAGRTKPIVTEKVSPRLQRGPAYESARLAAGAERPAASQGDWPTYRCDAARSGAAQTEVPAELERAWQAELGGGRLSSLVIADGKVFVAQIDSHTVYALDAGDGRTIWSYTAGGRIDSPPTVHRGLVLFGSADGWLVCLRASDGELAWRFRAGPEDRRIVVEGGLESAWPISGSVLLHDGRVYFAAGRSSFLDGGIYLYALDPFSGKSVAETLFSGRDPETGEQPKAAIRGFDMPGGLPDVLSTDGTFIYMRDLKFDDQLVQQQDEGIHLFSATGFLDDSWWHRGYWIYGSHFQSGWGGWHQAGNRVPAGRLLVFDDSSIYGFGRNFYPRGNAGQWRTGEYYRMFAASKKLKTAKPMPQKKRRGKKAALPSAVDYRWSQRVEPEVRAMVLTGDTLFIAGPHGQTHRRLAAFEGKQGISLQAISTADGKVLATHKLDSLPVFDGLAAARGRLYLSSKDGKVVCFRQR